MLAMTNGKGQQLQEEQVRIRTFPEYSAEAVINSLVSINGPVDVYCWYEGPRGLLKTCTDCWNEPFFVPIFKAKKEVKLFLYSLRGWNFKQWNVSSMPDSTPIGEMINRMNRTAFECVYSFSFFRFCVQAANEPSLYAYVTEELPRREWLKKLSAHRDDLSITVSNFFDNHPSLFDCIKTMDVAKAYSCMQYIEGYYLIQEAVKKALSKGDIKVEVSFLLPRGEEMYYTSDGTSFSEFRNDIEKMLRLQFKEALIGFEVNISFLLYQYKESTKFKPHINHYSRVIKEKELCSLFNNLKV